MKKINKKGLAANVIATVMITIIIFFLAAAILIPAIRNYSQKESQETLCRISVALKSKYTSEAHGKLSLPLMCDPITDVKIPENKDTKKERVMEELAKKLTRCWWMFGEGYIKHPIGKYPGKASVSKTCYAIETNKWKTEKNEEMKISKDEFDNYIRNTVLTANPAGSNCYEWGGKCTTQQECDGEGAGWNFDEDDKKNQLCGEEKVCCFNKDDPCKNKGGKCFPENEQPTPSDEWVMINKDAWFCAESDYVCWVEKKNAITYHDYITGFKINNEGDLKRGGFVNFEDFIEPDKVYSILITDLDSNDKMVLERLDESLGHEELYSMNLVVSFIETKDIQTIKIPEMIHMVIKSKYTGWQTSLEDLSAWWKDTLKPNVDIYTIAYSLVD